MFEKRKPRSEKATTAAAPVTMREVSKQLDVDESRLSRESGQPWFPQGQKVPGRKKLHYYVAEVRAARAENVDERKNAAPAAPIATANDEFIQTLRSGTSTALEINNAAMQLTARRLADSATAGTPTTAEIDGLKKLLQELRANGIAEIDLEERKKTLVKRVHVEMIMMELVARFINAVTLLESSLALEFSAWLADPKIRDAPAEDRSRLIREFIAGKVKEVRQMEADGVEAILKQINKEDANGAEDEAA